MRALCVDDHAVNRRVLVGLLAAAGIDTDEAESAIKGLSLIDDTAYDLIFMDLRMPEMDGLQAIDSIRARPDGKRDVPIILLTADTEFSVEARRKGASYNDALFKPVNPRALFDVIARVLLDRGGDVALV